MNEYGPKEIKRRMDGSIDIDFYAAKGLSARCEAGSRTFRAAPWLIQATVQLIARWFARAVRPRITLN